MVSPAKIVIPIVVVAVVIVATLLILTRPGGLGVTGDAGRTPTQTPTATTPTTETPTQTTPTIRVRESFVSFISAGLTLFNDTRKLLVNLTISANNVTLLGTVDLSIIVGGERIERKGVVLPSEYVNKTVVGFETLRLWFEIELNEREAAILSRYSGISVLVNVTMHCINIVERKPEIHYPRTPLYATVNVVVGTQTDVTETVESPPIRTPTPPGYW